MASSFKKLFRKKGKRVVADEEEGGLVASTEPPRRVLSRPSGSSIFGSSNDEVTAPAASSSMAAPPIPLVELSRQASAIPGSSSSTSQGAKNSESTLAIKGTSQTQGTSKEEDGDHKTARAVIDNAIKVTELTKAAVDATSIGGPVKAACGATQIVLQAVQDALIVDNSWKSLLELLESHFKLLEDAQRRSEPRGDIVSPIPPNKEFIGALESYYDGLEKIRSEATKYTIVASKRREEKAAQYLQRGATAKSTAEQISDLTNDLKTSFGFLHSSISTLIMEMSSQIDAQTEKLKVLLLLGDVDAQGQRVRKLVEGTRKSLVGRLDTWSRPIPPTSNIPEAENVEEQVFWLRDEAGTGKSVVAAHMAQQWQTQNVLLGRFFFNKNDRLANVLDKFCFSVAKDLSQLHPRSQRFIIRAFESHPHLDSLPFDLQWEYLIFEVVMAITAGAGKPLILVIDALDECKTEHASQLADRLIKRLPPQNVMKVLLTSRRTRAIDSFFETATNVGGSDACLLDIKHGTEERDRDVEIYVRERLDGSSLTSRQQQIVIDCAAGVFLCAQLACDALLKTFSPAQILRTLESAKPNETLQVLYETVLESAMPDAESKHLLINVLKAVALTFQPISIFTIESFYPAGGQYDRDTEAASRWAKQIVDELGSVMKDGTIYLPIYLLHPTFRTFLISQDPSAAFYLAPPTAHAQLAIASFDLIDTLPAKVQRHYVATRDWSAEFAALMRSSVEERDTLEKDQDMPRRYSVIFWAHHVANALEDDKVRKRLLLFFEKRLLVCLEWAAAMEELDEVMNGLLVLRNAIRVTKEYYSLGNRLEKWCDDALNFTRRHHLVIERYPLQVHISALIFTPQDSLVTRTYHSQVASTLPAVLTGISDVYTHSKVLDRDRPEVDWFQFSPDGRRLLTLGSQSHLQLWDVKTGSMITHMIAGEVVDNVQCAIYSHNGTLIASGGAKGNSTVSLWDGVTGKLLQLLPRQYRSTITSLVFVLRDHYIVSASEDGRLRRWPASFAGKKEYIPEIKALDLDDHRGLINIPSQGITIDTFDGIQHNGQVSGLISSPNSKILASFSEKDTKAILWDPEGVVALGSLDVQPRHIKDPVLQRSRKGLIFSIAFSNDNATLFIGCIDGTVRVCDVQRCIALSVIETDISTIDHLIVCPVLDVLVVASKRNPTVEIWDLRSRYEAGTTNVSNIPVRIKSHRKGVKTLSFSPNGNRLASGGTDRTIRLWEIQRQMSLQGGTLKPENTIQLSGAQVITGHGHNVDLVALASGGTRLVSRSRDKTLRLWELTEDELPRPPEPDENRDMEGSSGSNYPSWEYGENLRTLQFSKDGKRLICGSTIGGIQLWDTCSGKKLCGVHPESSKDETGFVARLSCLALANLDEGSNEDLFAAGYQSSSLLFFQSPSSDSSQSLSISRLAGHKSALQCIEFSEDRTRLVSGEWDGIIHVWDINSKILVTSFNCRVPPHLVALSSGASQMLACASTRSLFVWDMSTGSSLHPEDGLKFGQGLEPTETFTFSFHSNEDHCFLAFRRERSMDVLRLKRMGVDSGDRDGQEEASQADDRMCYLYQGTRVEVEGRCPVAWSDDGRLIFDGLITTQIDGIEDTSTQISPAASREVDVSIVSPFSPMLVCNTKDGVIRAQGVNGYRKLVLTLPRDTKIERWDSFGDRIALGSFDGRILLIKFPPGYVPEQQTALFTF